MAPAGQACWQAVSISPSRDFAVFFSRRVMRRCVDALDAVGAFLHHAAAAHLTSGLRIILYCGVSQSWNSRKLKRRTL